MADQHLKTAHQHASNGEKVVAEHNEHERVPGRPGFKPYSDEELVRRRFN